jgi:hypothetical protein
MHAWTEAAHVCTQAGHTYAETCQWWTENAAAKRLTRKANSPVWAGLRRDITSVDEDIPRLHRDKTGMRQLMRAVREGRSRVHEDVSAVYTPRCRRRRSFSRVHSARARADSSISCTHRTMSVVRELDAGRRPLYSVRGMGVRK